MSFNTENFNSNQLYRDSKLLNEAKRENFFQDILNKHWVGIGSATSKEVDRVNILQATFLAMSRAVEDLVKNFAEAQPCEHPKIAPQGHIIVDGIYKIPQVLDFTQSTMIKGDQLVSEISAASIVAKVSRDRFVNQLDVKYHEYGFRKHKGYGTLLHRKKIAELGPCPEHRITFKGVREFLHLKQKYPYQRSLV